jgi:hypothetical protein
MTTNFESRLVFTESAMPRKRLTVVKKPFPFSSGLSDGVKVVIRLEVKHHEILGSNTDTDSPADHST